MYYTVCVGASCIHVFMYVCMYVCINDTVCAHVYDIKLPKEQAQSCMCVCT